VPHHAEARVVGRHRREQSPRHRAPQATFPLPLAGERGRNSVVAATLGAALLAGVGVASGSAAAAAQRHGSVPDTTADTTAPAADASATPFAVDTSGATGASVAAGTSDSTTPSAVAGRAHGLSRDLAPAKDTPWDGTDDDHVTTGIGALPVKRKARPLPAVRAAWVNPNPTAAVTSCFGQRWGRLHAGVDLAAADGTPIVAAGAGVVVRAGVAEGYGNAVLIDHGNGYLTHYGHLSRITVQVGQHVRAGEQIGNEGSTGHSTGPHLHFEVHQGYYKNPIEPTRWMHDHGVDIPGCADLTP
jgi:murein DD-endopeptidase MepM/ murein hydrolase activator NlpD